MHISGQREDQITAPRCLGVYPWTRTQFLSPFKRPIPFLSIKQKVGREVLLTQIAGLRQYSPLPVLDKRQFSHSSHCFQHLPWTLILRWNILAVRALKCWLPCSFWLIKMKASSTLNVSSHSILLTNSPVLTSHLQCNDLQFYSFPAAK